MTFLPAYLGAEPWTASKMATLVAVVAGGRETQPADQAGGEVADDVARQVGGHEDVELGRVLDHLVGHVVDDEVLGADVRVLGRQLLEDRA